MNTLNQLNPKDVFQYFETICSIPHGSGNTAALANYCVEFAKERGFVWYRDAANNVVIRKAASAGYEAADTLILQGHLDMVCEKDPDVTFDFEKDGIQTVVDGDFLRAKGTTLGGDNGIAVAMILALLSDDALKHPALEALLTADEEIGMVGAFAFDCAQLTGKKLINLDSEYEGVLMCSCAGGANAYSTLPVTRETATLQLVDLEIAGLCSGHSGVEIDKGRANSNVLMARLLQGLSEKAEYRLVSLEGGSRETAIAAKTNAVIGVAADLLESIQAAAKAYGATFQMEYATAEPNMTVTLSIGAVKNISALSADSTKRVLQVLIALPDGVQTMSVDIPGLVQTSLNFGVMKLREEELYCANTIRSSMATQKEWIKAKIKAIFALAGGMTQASGDYPGWSYNPNSFLKDTIVRIYEEMTGKKPTVEAVHAGIECGLFAGSIANLDCISIGPDMADVHTPKEHLSISSTERTYTLLKRILEESR